MWLYRAAFVGVIVLIYAWFRFNGPMWVLISLILIGILLLILFIRAGYTIQWTGFKGKTLWDWLQLLGVLAIPIVVAGATLLFGIQQAQSSLDQQRADALQKYVDNIQDLLLNHNLLGDTPLPKNDADKVTIQEVQEFARARTLTALAGLKDDGVRKGFLLYFLYEARLIGFQDNTSKTHDAIIHLDGANLIGIVLDDANLSGVVLGGNSQFSTSLFEAKLSKANLTEAKLSYTNLDNAILSGAFLNNANLTGARLKGANLTDASLNGAILVGTGITQQQLDTVSSCKDAILPFLLTCHNNQ
jgi:uncharacterized protein YjbI with pentapeptide repeats